MRFQQNVTMTPPIAAVNNLAEEVRITGLIAVGPLSNLASLSTGLDANNSEIFVSLEYYDSDEVWIEVWRYLRHNVSPSWEKVWDNAGLLATFNANFPPSTTSFALGRTNSADTTVTGPAVLAWVTAGNARFFPDDTTPTATSTAAMPGDATTPPPDRLVLHQGRAVIMPLSITGFGTSATFIHNETIYFTNFNDFTTLSSDSTIGRITVGPESPTGYGVSASLSANELFLVKQYGGGLLISGDLNGVGPSSPTAKTMPYIKSTGFSQNNGTLSPLGYVYPVDGGGVWMWQGGDFVQNISKPLLPEFWRPPATSISGAHIGWNSFATQCATVGSWTLFPNNWLWDTDNGGWWRTENPATFTAHRWSGDWRGRKVYATTSGFITSAQPVLREFDLTTSASSFSWTSQPIAATIESSVTIKEFILIASGTGTVVVTITSAEDPTGQSRTFTYAAATTPQATRVSFGVRGSHVQIRLQSASTDALTTALLPAPTIHEFRYAATVPNPIKNEGGL